MQGVDQQATWYEQYLASEHWRLLRERKLDEQNHRCERCGFRGRRELGNPSIGLNVHHRTYDRIKAEQLDDLEVLCEWCHCAEHGIDPGFPNREQWEASLVDRALGLSRRVYRDELDDELRQWDELAAKAGM